MPEFVRVKHPSGAEITVTAANAKRHRLEVLDKPATDPVGKPLPPKPHVPRKGAGRKSPAPVTPNAPESPADEQKEG